MAALPAAGTRCPRAPHLGLEADAVLEGVLVVQGDPQVVPVVHEVVLGLAGHGDRGGPAAAGAAAAAGRTGEGRERAPRAGGGARRRPRGACARRRRRRRGAGSGGGGGRGGREPRRERRDEGEEAAAAARGPVTETPARGRPRGSSRGRAGPAHRRRAGEGPAAREPRRGRGSAAGPRALAAAAAPGTVWFVWGGGGAVCTVLCLGFSRKAPVLAEEKHVLNARRPLPVGSRDCAPGGPSQALFVPLCGDW